MLHKHIKSPSSCKRFVQAKDGVTSVEFAFIAPAVLMLMAGTVEFSLVAFTASVMESATSTTARFGKTGFIAPGSSREDQIVENLQTMTAGLLNPTDIMVTTTVYPMLDDVGTAEPFSDTNDNGMYNAGEPYDDINGNAQWDADMGLQGAGDANDIVVYTVSYSWPIFTPIINSIIGDSITLSARTVVKNEPYNVQF